MTLNASELVQCWLLRQFMTVIYSMEYEAGLVMIVEVAH